MRNAVRLASIEFISQGTNEGKEAIAAVLVLSWLS
jgi:hypothetical protein